MGLSNDIISQFVDLTNGDRKRQNDITVYGTIVSYNNANYVRLDGSDVLTPISTTTNVSDGERVTVMIKNHEAVVTGNITAPSATNKEVDKIISDIHEFDLVITEELEAHNAKIENLIAENVTINGTLNAVNANIENLKAQNVEISGTLIANKAEIDDLKVNKLDAKEATITYANIDFANIGMAAIKKLFADSGIIKDLVVDGQHITGELVGVKIKGDLIEGNTIVAEKLIIKGKDGLYYKLNTDGVKIEAEQTEYNSISGSIITAKTITANKINVSDLVAFGATIGGFNITTNSLYSGVKENINNTTKGIYLDRDGQLCVGDQNNFLKFFRDTDGKWKLNVSASTVRFGSSGADISETFDGVYDLITDKETSILKKCNSSIEKLEDRIRLEVKEKYTQKTDTNELRETLTSQINQTGKDVIMTFNKVTSETKDDIQSFRNEVTTYIKFSEDGMELGKTNSKFKTKLSNERLSFTEDNAEIAYIGNRKLNITDAEVTNKLVIGNFAFVPRSNGNTSLKWIG